MNLTGASFHLKRLGDPAVLNADLRGAAVAGGTNLAACDEAIASMSVEVDGVVTIIHARIFADGRVIGGAERSGEEPVEQQFFAPVGE